MSSIPISAATDPTISANTCPVQLPLPSRKELRAALIPYTEKDTGTALRLIAVDYLLFFTGLGLIAGPTMLWVKVIAALLVWTQIARLFILGHDACHQSLTPDRRLNKVLGRLVFLPSLTPFKLWELGHNMAHHGFTNLRGKDYVWAPFSPAEFAQLSFMRRLCERYYRSGNGHWLYYLVELWWKKLYFPSQKEVGGSRYLYVPDCLLVTAFAATWMGALAIAAYLTGQSVWLLVGLGFLLPFMLWNGLMGFVIYVHHTDPSVCWYQDGQTWAKAQPHLTATIHIQFPGVIGTLLHHIMEHPAHHLDMTIPSYRLKAAQSVLDDLVPGRILKRRFTWSAYWRCVRVCKLFDYQSGQWVSLPK